MVVIQLKDLKVGDTFRYINSDERDWHTVSRLDEEKLYYQIANDKMCDNQRNHIEVILKQG